MSSEHNRRYAAAIRTARESGPAAFQSWFDASESVEESVLRGYWDFALHILTPPVCALLSQPERATALEIGYGGGRLLNAACSFFESAIGVDVHEDEDAVRAFLEAQGKANFTLLRGAGTTIDVDSSSVDFVYSFIVLQHLPSFDALEAYVAETARCLRPGGVAQLYLGAWRTLSRRTRLRSYRRGYVDIPEAAVNHTSLVVRTGRARELARSQRLRVVASAASWKRVPDGYRRRRGDQTSLTLLKPS